MSEYVDNLSPNEKAFLKSLQIFELRPYTPDPNSLTRPVDIGMRELLGLTSILEGKPLTEAHFAEALHRIGVVYRSFGVDTGNLMLISLSLQTLLLYQVQVREGQFYDLITTMLKNTDPA